MQSPWLSTTQFVTLAPHPSTSQELPPFDPTLPVQEDITSIFTSHEGNSTLFKKSSPSSDLASWKGDPKARKDFFGNSTNSEGIVLSNDMVVLAEFAHGHIDFSTLSLKLPLLPSLPLAKYWYVFSVSLFSFSERCQGNKFTNEFALLLILY